MAGAMQSTEVIFATMLGFDGDLFPLKLLFDAMPSTLRASTLAFNPSALALASLSRPGIESGMEWSLSDRDSDTHVTERLCPFL